MLINKRELLNPGQRVRIDITGRGDYATGKIISKTIKKKEMGCYQTLYLCEINEWKEIKELNRMQSINVPEDCLFPY